MAEGKLLLRVPEAAERLSISRAKTYELISTGELGSIRIDGSRRIPVDDLQRFVDRLRDASQFNGTRGSKPAGEAA